MDDLDDILGEFVAESLDDLERLDEALAELSPDHQAAIFRTLHTIKGTAGFFDLDELQRLAHRGETLLTALRDGGATGEARSEVRAAVAAVRGLLEKVRSALPRPPASNALERVLAGSGVASASAVFDALDTADGTVVAEPVVPRLGDILVERGLVTAQDVDDAIAAQRAGDARHLGEILVDHGLATAEDVFEALNAQSSARTGGADASVRVDVALLDGLLDAVAQLAEVCDDVVGAPGLESPSARLVSLTARLQRGLSQTRMQPIGAVFEKLPRAVRTLEDRCGKRVRLEIHGAELELDRTVIEAVKGPLTHLVRNAVDHGLESPDVRRAAGKPELGTLTVRAYSDDALAHVQVSDDGRGLDLRRLCERAVHLGVLDSDAVAGLTPDEMADLLFVPGLSTAGEVSPISGRGVGMDAVRSSVESLSGSVTVRSVPGEGTTFTLSFPPSVSMVPALVVADRGETFVIPRRSIVEVFAYGAGAGAADREMAVVRAGGSAGAAAGDVVVVVMVDGGKVGVVVDGVVAEQDIVLKPAAGAARRVVVTERGTLATVLDSAALAAVLAAVEVRT